MDSTTEFYIIMRITTKLFGVFRLKIKCWIVQKNSTLTREKKYETL